MIRYKNKKVIPYVGDHKPANVYKKDVCVAKAERNANTAQLQQFLTEYKSRPITRINPSTVREEYQRNVCRVFGNTKKWNQLVNGTRIQNYNYKGLSYHFENGYFNVSGTNNGTRNNIGVNSIGNLKENDKFICIVKSNISLSTAGQILVFNEFKDSTYVRTIFVGANKIISIGDDVNSVTFEIVGQNTATTVSNLNWKFIFSCANLTEMYGSGNEPSTVEQFLSDHPEYNNYVPYQPTTALSSVETSGVTYCGKNLASMIHPYARQDRRNVSVFYNLPIGTPISGMYIDGVAFAPSNVTVKSQDDNSIIYTGRSGYSVGFYLGKGDGKTKYLSASIENVSTRPYILRYDVNGDFVDAFNPTTSFNSDSRYHYFIVYLRPYNMDPNLDSKVSNLYFSDYQSSYVPYFSQTINFVPYVVLSGLATQDEIYSYVDGNELVTKKVERYAKITVDKNSGWNQYGTLALPKYSITGAKALGSKLGWQIVNNYYLVCNEATTSTKQEILDLIGESTIDIVYPLATPTITEISRVPLTCDFDAVTNIIVSNSNEGLVDASTSMAMESAHKIINTTHMDITAKTNDRVYRINGLTEKWNQLLNYTNFRSFTNYIGLTATKQNGIYSVTGTTTAVADVLITYNNVNASPSHKMLAIINGTISNAYFKISEYANGGWLEDRLLTKSAIFTSKSATDFFKILIYAEKGKDVSCSFAPYLVDLTSIFGSGSEPTSVDDPRIQRLIEIAKRRQQYDEGSLLSASKIYDQDDNLIYDLDEPIRSAMVVTDVLSTDGAVDVNVGEVDLGTLNWSNIGRFRAQLSDGKYIYPNAQNYFVCEMYNVCDWTTFSNTADKVLSSGGSDARACYIDIKDSSYTDAQSFKSAMSGVKLQYELKAPTTRTVQSKYLEAGLTFHDEYGRELTATEQMVDHTRYDADVDFVDFNANDYIITSTRVGKNLWDEEWERGNYNPSTGEKQVANSVCNKNPIKVNPSTKYFCKGYSTVVNDMAVFYYDGNMNYLSFAGFSNYVFTTPSNCEFINFYCAPAYGMTYKHDIAIMEYTSGMDTSYEPYLKDKVFHCHKTGVYTVADLNWTYANGYFSASVPNIGSAVISDYYNTGTYPSTDDQTICINNGYVIVYDSRFKDATSFANVNARVKIIVGLSNPVWEEITDTDAGQVIMHDTVPHATHTISIDMGTVETKWYKSK